MALEIQIHPLAEVLRTDQRMDHAHDLGAFFVDRGRVEVADFHVRGGTDRMRHRSRVLRELGGAQRTDFLDALHRSRIGVGAVLLVAEYGETFLQRQLEPVAASHAVSSPVMEVFVRHHAIEEHEIGVGRGVRAREHIFGVEDVQALVLHRPHVEIADRDDHVLVQVEFEAKYVLVPFHRALQGLHRESALIELARFDEDRELHFAARTRHEIVLQPVQFRRDHGEQVGGFRKRVFPFRPMPAAGFVAAAIWLPLDSRNGNAALSAWMVLV